MIGLKSSGSFKNTESFLNRAKSGSMFTGLDKFGQMGVDALSSNTPRDSGDTANSWGYRVIQRKGRFGIEWYNTNVNQGTQIAILIQYGHGTGTGGYVPSYDYINPAMRPIFEKIIDEVWKQVNK